MATGSPYGPELEILMVRENLSLAIAYWTAVRKGRITSAHLPANRDVVTTETGRVVEVINPLTVRNQAELARCATNQVRGAFAFSAMQSHRTLESIFPGSPLAETKPGLRAARCCLYLLDRSFRMGMLDPVWSCPDEYRQRYEADTASFVLDATRLNGEPISWDDFGGLESYLGLLEYCAGQVQGRARHAPLADESSTDSVLVQTPQRAEPELNGAAAAPEVAPSEAGIDPSDPDSVTRFVSQRCIVGPDARIIASGLYSAYVEWCGEEDELPMVQRSFGMRLSGMGFTRRRRGRGRHWWEGVGLEEDAN